jgi:hypothetical protein
MKCDVHKSRGGILFVDLPSIGVRRWGCFECRANFDKKMLNSPRPSRKEWWIENEPFYGWNDENHAYLNSNAEVMRRKNYKDSGRNE